MEHTLSYLNHKVTCTFEYIEDTHGFSGYYWITGEVPYYPCPLVSKTLEGLKLEIQSVIDRWSKYENKTNG